MKFTVQQADLLGELTLALGAVENKVTIPHSESIHLKVIGSALILTTTNVEMAIKSRVPISDTDGEGEVVLAASALHSWASSLPPDAVISCSLGKRFNVSSGGSKGSFALKEADGFPHPPAVGPSIAEVEPESLAKILSGVSFVTPNFDDPALKYSAILFSINENEIVAASTDGNRLGVVSAPFDGKCAGVKILLPKKTATVATKLAGKSKSSKAKIFVSRNSRGEPSNVFFGFGDRLLYSAVLAGRFPDYRRGLPKMENQQVATLKASDAVGALSRLLIFADEKSKAVVFELNGSLNMSSDSDGGDGVESVTITYSGPPTKVRINSSWVLDAARAMGDSNIDFCITSPASPAEIRKSEDASYRYVMAPMNID